MTSFAGSRCLITGAASGIGRACAFAAAARGAQLVLTDVNEEALAAVAAELGPAVLLARAADVSSIDEVRALAAEVHEPLDIVMNVAGIAIWGSVQTLRHEDWRRVIDVNLMGPIHVIECFVAPMAAGGRGGHLVNVSSAAGLFGLPLHAAYSASKFGLRGVSEVLRFDLRANNIKVSLVCPGGVDTGLVETMQIAGVDRDEPGAKRLTDRFRRHAVSAEHAAEAIMRGVERNRYMVYTSPDIRFGFWVQRKLGWPYELAMRVANAVARKAFG